MKNTSEEQENIENRHLYKSHNCEMTTDNYLSQHLQNKT